MLNEIDLLGEGVIKTDGTHEQDKTMHAMEDYEKEAHRRHAVVRRRPKIAGWAALPGPVTGAVAAAKSTDIIGCAASGSIVDGVAAFACPHKKKAGGAVASTANENWRDVE